MSDGADGTALDPDARGQLYHFLAAAYLRPLTAEALRRLTDADVLNELTGLFGAEATAGLREFAARAGREPGREELEQEFMDLFAVPAGRYVTPFEDVYRGTSADRQLGPLLGEHAVAVIRLYRAACGDVDETCKELPTHVGVELAFMSFLCAREAAVPRGDSRAATAGEGCDRAASADYRELQLRFLREHLNAWFPALNRAIQQRASSGLYRGLAELTQAVLERDATLLMTERPTRTDASATLH